MRENYGCQERGYTCYAEKCQGRASKLRWYGWREVNLFLGAEKGQSICAQDTKVQNPCGGAKATWYH
jgi:hypothetical protein